MWIIINLGKALVKLILIVSVRLKGEITPSSSLLTVINLAVKWKHWDSHLYETIEELKIKWSEDGMLTLYLLMPLKRQQ